MEAAITLSNSGEGEDNKPRPGRPRSSKARRSILEATRRLLTHMPMNDLSIEAIAKKAKVGKTTIYRWWPGKASVAMDAFIEQPGIQNIIPTTSSSEEAVLRQIENIIRQLRGQNGRIMAGIIAESQSDPAVLDLLYDRFLKERVEFLWEKIETGKKEGIFNAEIDTEIAIDLILGPVFLRVLSGEHGLDAKFAENFPAQAIKAIKV